LPASLFTRMVDWLSAMRALLRQAPDELTSWWVTGPEGDVLVEIINDKRAHWCSRFTMVEGEPDVNCDERWELTRRCEETEGCTFKCTGGGMVSVVPVRAGEETVAYLGLCAAPAEKSTGQPEGKTLSRLAAPLASGAVGESVADPHLRRQLKRAMRLFAALSRVVSTTGGSEPPAGSDYLTVLAETAQLVVSSLDLGEVLSTLTRRSAELLGVDNLAFYFLRREEGMLELASSSNPRPDLSEGASIPAGRGLVGLCYQSGVPFSLANLEEEIGPGAPKESPLRILRPSELPEAVKACLAVPMLDYGEVRGVVCAYSATLRQWREWESRYLQALGSLAIVAERSSQLNAAIRRRLSELETLHNISRSIATTLDLDKLLTLVAESSVKALNASGSVLYMYDNSTGKLSAAAAFGLGEYFARQHLTDPAAERVANTHEAVLQKRADKHPDYRHVYKGIATSVLCVPLMAKGEFLGALAVYDKLGEGAEAVPFEEDDLRLLSTFAGQASIALENARLFSNVQKAQEAARKAQLDLAESEKLAALGALTASLAHEIRNPMASIGGLARRLVKLLPEDDPNRRYAELIQSETSRLLELLRSTLDFARGPKPRYSLERPETFLLEPLELVNELLKTSKVKTVTRLAPNLPEMLCDVNGLKQAFLNLYQNAAEAMPEGGTLTVSARASKSQLQVEVADTGEGIPEDVKPRLFQPFFTSKQSGTGLGLSLVSHIIKQHGGTISVESETGKGTVFKITLPIRQGGQPDFAETPPVDLEQVLGSAEAEIKPAGPPTEGEVSHDSTPGREAEPSTGDDSTQTG